MSRKVASPIGEDEHLRVALGRVGERMIATPIQRGAGVITSLARPRHGTMTIETPHRRFRVDLARLGPRGRGWDLGGLGQRLTVCRLPPPDGPRDVSFVFRPRPEQLHDGDNPLYVHVVQEDGHMAWSSPVYLVR